MPAPIWLAMAMVTVRALTKMTEFIGVLNFGCRCENQRGSRQSQPATIGNRELPVTWTLVDAIVLTVIKIMAMDAMPLAIGKKRNPSRSVCGTGPIRSIGLSPMNASADRELRENVDAIKDRHGRRGDDQRMIFLQIAAHQRDERQCNERSINAKH